MKNYVLTIAVLLFVLMSGNSYSLNNFNYSGIALNSTGEIMPNATVNVTVTISNSGGVQYSETHSGVSTDQFGTYTVEVGAGTPVNGSFAGITITAETRIKMEANGVLSIVANLSDVLSRIYNSAGTGWDIEGNAGTTAGTNFIGTTDNVPFEMRVANGSTTENQLFLGKNNEIYRENPNLGGWVAGNTRGQGAVDLQGYRTDASQVASGYYSTIGGGYQNTASGNRSTVAGGSDNTASGDHSTVGGGLYNTASGYDGTVGGGVGNIASGMYSTVGGGYSNTASGDHSTVGGGYWNRATGDYSTVGGGYWNTAQSYGETVAGLFATVGAGSATSYVASDRLFVIGNGTGTSARSNALVMLKNGNTTLNGDLTATGNATLGNDATADVTTLNSALVTKYNTDNSGAAFTIPVGTMVMDIDANAAATAFTVTLPSGTNGQILYIHLYNVGAGAVTINGTPYSAAANITCVYTNGGWVTF